MHLPRFITRLFAPDESRFSCLTKGILKSMREHPEEWTHHRDSMWWHNDISTTVHVWFGETSVTIEGNRTFPSGREQRALAKQLVAMVEARDERFRLAREVAAAPIKAQWERLGCPPTTDAP